MKTKTKRTRWKLFFLKCRKSPVRLPTKLHVIKISRVEKKICWFQEKSSCNQQIQRAIVETYISGS